MSSAKPFILSVLEEVDSTNDHLKKRYATLPLKSPHVLVAKKQSNGRGQRGKKWTGEEGKSLFFTLAISGEQKTPAYFLTATAVAVHAFIAKLLPASQQKGLSIKWPNDILMEGKKLAGILVESTFNSNGLSKVFVGVGLNIEAHDIENADRQPVFLQEYTDKKQNVEELASGLAKELIEQCKMEHQTLLVNYNKHLYLKDEQHFFEVKGEKKEGTIIAVRKDGFLHLKTKEENVLLESGELKYLS